MEIKQALEEKQYFIFDMDGTIVDLENLNFEGYKGTIKKFYNMDLSEADYQKYFSGTKTALAFKSYLEIKGIVDIDVDVLIEDFRNMKRNNLQNNIEKVVSLKENVVEYFQYLKSVGKKMVLATSTVKEFVDIIIRHFDLNRYFDLVLAANDVTKSKPDPEIYNISVNRLNAKKENCVVFEDSSSGIQSARNAGIFCIGILTEGLNDQSADNADYMIRNYGELF